MRVLVTGATGFLGTHVLEDLRARGHRGLALVRPQSDTAWLEREGFELAPGRFDDPASLERAVSDADAVVHCAGGGKVRSVQDFYDANLETTRALLGAVERGAPRIERFVLVSSLAAAGPSSTLRAEPGAPRREEDPPAPRSHYGKSKLAAEQLVLEVASRVPLSIVRPPAVYGPRDTRMLSLFRWARRGLLPGLGRGHTASIVFGPDCARAITLCLERPHPSGRIFFVEDGRAWSTAELGRAIAHAMDAPRALEVPLPVALLRTAGYLGELAGRVRRRAVALNRDKIQDLAAPHWLCASDRARSELGWSPQVEFPEGAALTARWYRESAWL